MPVVDRFILDDVFHQHIMLGPIRVVVLTAKPPDDFPGKIFDHARCGRSFVPMMVSETFDHVPFRCLHWLFMIAPFA